jgi:hypothetical protein
VDCDVNLGCRKHIDVVFKLEYVFYTFRKRKGHTLTLNRGKRSRTSPASELLSPISSPIPVSTNTPKNKYNTTPKTKYNTTPKAKYNTTPISFNQAKIQNIILKHSLAQIAEKMF